MSNSVPSTSSSEPSLSTFSLFKEFPLEIRQMIWKNTLPGPRIVILHMGIPHDGTCDRVRSDIDINDPSNNEFFDFAPMARFRRNCPWGQATFHVKRFGPIRSYVPKFLAKNPIITAVCVESRVVASMFYTLAFGSRNSPPCIWFSFDRDTLHMPEHVIAGFERGHYSVEGLGPDVDSVKHLSIADSYLKDEQLDEEGRGRHDIPHLWCSKTISLFSNLQSISYTVTPGSELTVPGGDLILIEVQEAAAALDLWDKTEYEISGFQGQWFWLKNDSTKPFPEGWQREVVDALDDRLAERVCSDNSRGKVALLKKFKSIKVNRKALSTTQDPDMTLRLNAVMKEIEEVQLENGRWRLERVRPVG